MTISRRTLLAGLGAAALPSLARAAIKQMQLKFGQPADSYPTPELLARLRAGR